MNHIYSMSLLREYIQNLITEKIETDQLSTMIAIYPTDDAIKQIVKFRNTLDIPSDVRVIPPEELHCTIRYWKGDRKLEDILPFVNSLESKSISAKATKLEALGDSIVILLDSKELNSLFSKIDNGIQKHGIPPSDFPDYKAHISLYGGDKAQEVPSKKIPFDTLSLDGVKMVNEDDEVFWSSL